MATTLDHISADELKDALASDHPPVVINTLPSEAHRARHIPGSINIPVDHIDEVEDLIPFKDERIVVYCANASCEASPKAARELESMGYTNVVDFEDGYTGWRRAGYSLVGEDV